MLLRFASGVYARVEEDLHVCSSFAHVAGMQAVGVAAAGEREAGGSGDVAEVRWMSELSCDAWDRRSSVVVGGSGRRARVRARAAAAGEDRAYACERESCDGGSRRIEEKQVSDERAEVVVLVVRQRMRGTIGDPSRQERQPEPPPPPPNPQRRGIPYE